MLNMVADYFQMAFLSVNGSEMNQTEPKYIERTLSTIIKFDSKCNKTKCVGPLQTAAGHI